MSRRLLVEEIFKVSTKNVFEMFTLKAIIYFKVEMLAERYPSDKNIEFVYKKLKDSLYNTKDESEALELYQSAMQIIKTKGYSW